MLKAKSVATAILLVLVITFASIGVVEHSQLGSLSSQIQSLSAKSNASTVTSVSTSTITVQQAVSTTLTILQGQPIPIASVETADVTIGGYVPASVAVNPTTGRVYAATNTSLIVIEGSSGMILANITLPAGDEFAGNQDNIAIDSASNVI